jgi:hypothetical protein
VVVVELLTLPLLALAAMAGSQALVLAVAARRLQQALRLRVALVAMAASSSLRSVLKWRGGSRLRYSLPALPHLGQRMLLPKL